MDPIAVIFNPSSGRGRSLKKKDHIQARFRHHGIPFTWFTSQSEEHLKELARRQSREFAVIAAVGGDTTFTLAATEIMSQASDTALAPVATGSSNDISRGLGIYDLERLCGALRSGLTRRMDAGCLHLPEKPDPIFFMGALSLGLGVEVNLYVEQARRRFSVLKRGGSPVQALTGAAAVRHSFVQGTVPQQLRLESGPRSHKLEYSLLIFANSPFFANGIRILPDATPFDGLITCYCLRTGSLTHTLQLLRSILRGTHLKRDEVEIIPGEFFQVEPEGGSIALQYDGEVVSRQARFSVSVRPAALKVVTSVEMSGEARPA
jgi:diacylglycerol kinase (ATP)